MEIATSNADGSMRDLSDILADCRVAFDQMSESEKASAAQALVGQERHVGFPCFDECRAPGRGEAVLCD